MKKFKKMKNLEMNKLKKHVDVRTPDTAAAAADC
jgi:hypothetical protein